MQRPIFAILLSLFCCSLPPAWGAERGALFKVSGNGHTMHLFGTMHVGVPAFYPLEPRIARAVAGASTLVLEIDAGRDPALMAGAMSRHALAAAGGGLHRQLTPDLRQRLDTALAQAGIVPAAVAGFRPWLVVTLLALAEYGAQGYRPELAVDLHLAQLARASGVAVIELESVEGQLALFARLSDSEQVRLLEETVVLIEKGRQRAEVRQIVEAWSNADKAALDAIAHRIREDHSIAGRFLRTVLLDERNVMMADKLAQLLARQDNSVAAVGVLHLVGTHSVPELLRARGITVERVY
jgi:uncharacterized protein YbaP (TraB family)